MTSVKSLDNLPKSEMKTLSRLNIETIAASLGGKEYTLDIG